MSSNILENTSFFFVYDAFFCRQTKSKYGTIWPLRCSIKFIKNKLKKTGAEYTAYSVSWMLVCTLSKTL